MGADGGADDRAGRSRWLLPLAVALITLAVFAPTLANDFVDGWDDGPNLTENPNYRGFSAKNLEWMFTSRLMGHYQPLTWLSYAVDHALWGMDPAGYHLTNNLLHAVNAALVFLVICSLLAAARGETSAARGHAFAAAAGALFFALHPLRVEAVAWATARRDLLSTLFVLLSVLAYLRYARAGAPEAGPSRAGTSRRGLFYALSVLAFAASLLSKAWALTLPFALLVVDAYPLRRRSLRDKVPYLLLVLGAAYVALRGQAELGAVAEIEGHGALARGAQAAYGLCLYVVKTALPFGLCPFYEMPRPLDPLELRFVVSALAAVAVTVALVRARGRWPGVSAAWLAYAILIAPVLGLLQVGSAIAADRYTYGPCIAFAVLAAAAVRRARGRSLLATGAPIRFAAPIAIAVLVALALSTVVQIRVWRDSVRLWTEVVEHRPESTFALYNLGTTLHLEGRLEEAEPYYRRVLELDPNEVGTLNNLGSLLAFEGNVDDALALWRKSLELRPDQPTARRVRELIERFDREKRRPR